MAAMKSAMELAMEKIGRRQDKEPSVSLTDAQRQAIGELRKQYDAKIAEKEIMIQSETRRLPDRYPPPEIAAKAQELQQQLQEAKTNLRQELEDKVAAIRAQQ
ncbi:hypothetical protein NKDENANG_03244 [Candidatus Entotheonellaceae bacterium PAL068K]